MPEQHILMVRLGAMGDVIHCLPAAATLKRGIPESRLTWAIDPRWAPLLAGNPCVDEVVEFDRRSFASIRAAWQQLRSHSYDIAVDFQGLVKSALVASAAHPGRIFGFARDAAREAAATWFYSDAVETRSGHVVDRNLDLALAAGASSVVREFALPQGRPEDELPHEPFVLASPLAGWKGKQWPLEFYGTMGERLWKECGYRLVLNGSSRIDVVGTVPHVSSIDGLIDATRRATAVLGVDSGPMHLAAALGKPGVAIFGPTDPARNGPYSDAFTVLRAPGVPTTYKRDVSDTHMREVSPDMVWDALQIAQNRARAAAVQHS